MENISAKTTRSRPAWAICATCRKASWALISSTTSSLSISPSAEKEELISELKKAAKSSDTVYLATDPDREGEAISWHLKALLNLDDEKAKRVTFNEITKKVVSESIKEPRAIDRDWSTRSRRAACSTASWAIS